MKRLFSIISAILLSSALLAAQVGNGPSAKWTVSSEKTGEGLYKLVFTASIADGMHIYGTVSKNIPVSVEYTSTGGAALEGSLRCVSEGTEMDGETVYFGKAVYEQDIRVPEGSKAVVEGTINWQACTDTACSFPEDHDFKTTVGEGKAEVAGSPIPDPAEGPGGSSKGLWALILEAILWGFAMMLTPCVFPMVPMTVSFFLKGSENARQGRFKAFMYGFFIILLYTVPICLIIALTRIIGGEAVTADIFNHLATHWLPNIIFFIVFMVFAASFFGAFELTLPASWTTATDKNSGRKGLAGVFFMALTLVLVSFSCTGPIVGTVLIKSTAGEFWTPMVTMLAFSTAFALPFTVLALFPSLTSKLKSGSWLGSVKIVLGFIELALGLKFLSVADQTYHWGILDREVYLAIWITVFTLLGLYLLGIIRFRDEAPFRGLGVFRLLLAIIDIAFVVYMIPGMFGAPLKALSGYLPPLETQDFVIGAVPSSASMSPAPSGEDGPDLTLAHGLKGYSSYDKALAASKASGKPVFVDITGHGCVNCREMEARVWSDPQVLDLLRNEFVLLALYTDDKARLPKDQWVTTESGKVLKDIGRVNSYFVRERFGVSAQPNYVILAPDGTAKTPIRSYDLDIPAYKEFLLSGLE